MTDSLEVVATGAAAEAIGAHVPALVQESFASRLFAEDATLWGPEAEAEASVRLSWVGLPRSSRPLIGEVAAIRDELSEAGVDRVVLCGMGGSSLAPEVICAAAGVELVVLDSSQPDQVHGALAEGLERSVVVVSSKSGSTVETDSQRRAFEGAFKAAGIAPADRIVVVTDPGSPLDQEARGAGYRVVNADPDIGGRYSALSAFGLVPSGLAGADVAGLLDEAEVVSDLLAEDDDANPALRLGAAMAGTSPLRDKLVLVDEGSGLPGFPAWAEQLIAESTGKQGTGVLPVVVGGVDSPELADPAADTTVVRLVPDVEGDEGDADDGSTIRVSGSLGAQLLLWEAATAVAGRILAINPFDQPDVESAKKAARALLDAPAGTAEPDFTDGPVSVRTLGGGWLGEADTLTGAVDQLLGQVDADRGYLAVMVYLDRMAHGELEQLRETLAARIQRPVTFGWGPRFLHSTGQFHKGGPPVGVFLQVTGAAQQDLEVPGRDFSFDTLVSAQAAGDAQVLADHGRPVLRVHLEELQPGLERLREALR